MISSSKKIILQKFIEINELTPIPLWTEHTIQYSGGILTHAMKEEDLLASIEFAGFCDGYCGNPSKYQNPRGTVKRNEETLMAKIGRTIQEYMPEANKREITNQALARLAITDQERYQSQYDQGSQMKTI